MGSIDSPVSRKRPGSASLSPPPRSKARTVPGDVDPSRATERAKLIALKEAEARLAALSAPAPDATAVVRQEGEAMKKAALTKAGGAYIPPHRMRALMEQAKADGEFDDQAGAEFQRLSWDALRKSLNGLINKVNVANIKLIVPELFGENLIRGRGLFVRSIMRAQASSLPYSSVFASMVAIVNTKFPAIGALLLSRLIIQFRRSHKRNDKPTMNATVAFLAHLVNQRVVHLLLALQVFVLLSEHPTDDSIEIAVGFIREVGAFMQEQSPKGSESVFSRFRGLLHEGDLSKRVQYMIEVLMQVRKDKFKDNPAIPEGLDLVEEDDAIVHRTSLDDQLKADEMLNVFKYDPDFAANEEVYLSMKREILGDSEDEDESGEDDSGDEADSEDEPDDGIKADGTVDITDQSATNVVNLRRRIYLTIMSAIDFEEAVHKLIKMDTPEGQESELCNMVIECCSQERTFSKFYGLMGERFCKLHMRWATTFEQCFVTYYDTIHRYETNRLRNIARFFGHLLATDAIPWSVVECIKMNEDETTSSSRIFVKIMFQEMQEFLGLKTLVERFKSPQLEPYLANVFPVDNPRNTRFSINFFTSIGLGALTEDMREHLKKAPALLLEQQRALAAAGGGADSSSSDSDSSSVLSSSSLSESSSSNDSRSRSPPRRRRSYSRSRSYDSRSPSRSPPPRRRSPPPARRDRSYSRSRSPPRGKARYDSRSPPPPRRGSYGKGRPVEDDRDRRRGRSPTRSRSRSYEDRRGSGGGYRR